MTLTLAYTGVALYGLWLARAVDPTWGIAVLVAFPPAILYWHYFRHPRRASAAEQQQDRYDLAAAQARIQAAEASRRRAP